MIYDALKDVILNTSFKLEDILDKIYVMYSKDKLSKEEMEELEALARENAKVENSYAPLQEQTDKLYADLKEVKARVSLLEKDGQEEPTEPVEEYPQYIQPQGAHDTYNIGDKITYNGKKYICKMDGCVWTPDAYPQGWELVEEE